MDIKTIQRGLLVLEAFPYNDLKGIKDNFIKQNERISNTLLPGLYQEISEFYIQKEQAKLELSESIQEEELNIQAISGVQDTVSYIAKDYTSNGNNNTYDNIRTDSEKFTKSLRDAQEAISSKKDIITKLERVIKELAIEIKKLESTISKNEETIANASIAEQIVDYILSQNDTVELFLFMSLREKEVYLINV